MLRSLVILGLAAAALSACEEYAEVPSAVSVNGIPFSNYRCTDGSVVQVAYGEDETIVRIGEANTPVEYVASEFGVVYLAPDLVLTIDGPRIMVAGRGEAASAVPQRRCTYESGG